MLTKRALDALLISFCSDLSASGLAPEKLVLFGSYAKGRVHSYGDVDVAIWGRQFSGEGLHDYDKVQTGLRKYPILQAKLYPDFADENNFDPFIGEIIRTGISIL